MPSVLNIVPKADWLLKKAKGGLLQGLFFYKYGKSSLRPRGDIVSSSLGSQGVKTRITRPYNPAEGGVSGMSDVVVEGASVSSSSGRLRAYSRSKIPG